ncbi:maestro heat-like repeat family member 5 [Neomonachus schauinslandi]|uniref:Maestro heat-like repeat family member 5 n=1 Tax=Neomonachus schauinslandi TaxID=29088 RepID=A0A8M1MCL6_NEOSC|nr:maestro heat-like repeat family member 5 [Neomonachus schauinslandi]
MDGQHSEKPHSHSTADRTSSTTSQNSRFSSHVSRSTKDLSCMKVPQDPAHRDRQAHPTTILLCKSQSSQAALVPKEHKMFMEEAYNAAICFKMLQDLNSSDPLHLKYIIKKIKNMAYGAPNLVLETIHDYFVDNPEISSRHRFRLFHVLEAVIEASDSLEEAWEKSFMQLALENMTKSTEMEEVYQDAASNVLLAICRHSWQVVAQHLETEVLTGVFPHRSLLYVMGILTSSEAIFNQGEKACWEEQLAQMAVKSVQFLNTDVWSKELLLALTKPDQTHQEQPPEKAFLFIYYGLILQAEDNSTTVRTHVRTLSDTSHQWPKQREGIALTIGLAAVRHLDHVWAVLEQFGRSMPIRWSLHSFCLKNSEDLQWKWASSTILLAYGQMAVRAKAHILPWVDNILSRMVFYFHYSSWDKTLKQSFLTAVLMLVEAISHNEGAHSYEFSQISELLECLMVLVEKEPQDTLCTSTRQQTIHIVSGLCKLRPPLDLERKSRILSVCLHSVLALPHLDVLEKHTCLFLEPPNVQESRAPPLPDDNIMAGSPRELSLVPDTKLGLLFIPVQCAPRQTLYNKTSEALDQMLQSFIIQNPTADELHFLLSHLYLWLASEKAHERQRAVHSCMALLRFLSHNPYLDPKEDFRRIGQLVGMLGILCQDPDRATQHSSLEGVGHLYQLLIRQRARETPKVEVQAPEQLSQANVDGAPVWSSGDQKTAPTTSQEMAFPKDGILQLGSSQVIKEVMKHLTMVELTDLIWTAIDGLGSTSPFRVQAAADMLLTTIKEHGSSLETVANLGRAIHLQLCSVRIPQAKENALHAITLLARNHTQELVATFLDFSIPLDSHAFRLWRALGAEQPVSRLVLAMLLAWLWERPLPAGARDGSPQPKDKPRLHSLAAMNTLHELQFAREFKKAVQEAYPKMLLALLTQTHYILELNLPEEPQPGQKAPEAATSSPQSCPTSLEALKGLLSTTGHWQDFAHLELQGAWKLFTTIHTYPQGVGLLARAMVQNHCKQIKAVTSLLLASLQSKEERERKAAILILTEFLYSPALLEVLPRQAALTALARSLRDPSPEVRVLSLQGLGNILFHPEKVSLLRGQLPPFLDGFFQNSEQVVVQVMGTVSDMLHRLGAHGAGAQSLGVAINARFFFDDERDGIRAAAMALFGDLVAAVAGRELSGLRTQVHQSMVPLLLHLKDRCPAVVTQAKFALYRCAVLLRWPLRHTLFCTLAWERGLSARHFLWTCLMTHSQEEFGIHLAQALRSLRSRHQHVKTWAALFIGHTLCYQPQAVCQMVNSVDTNLLFSTFEDLKKDPEPGIREFATRQFSFLQKVAARPQ